ncbi:putative aldehyde dehydrogenase [Helianthus debilis subsp. tardiflorus]
MFDIIRVLQVLNNSDMDSTTEYQVRKLASEPIGIYLSEPSRKKLVRTIMQTYLEEQQGKAEAEEKVTEEGEPVEEEEDCEDDKKKHKGDKEYDDEGDLIVCRIADIAKGDKDDVDLAVEAARVAFDHRPWPRMSGSVRLTFTFFVIERLYAHE